MTYQPRLIGPHCSHDECAWTVCDHSGYGEFPCRQEGCKICGAPSVDTVEHWGGSEARFNQMTAEEQARVRAYWGAVPAHAPAGRPGGHFRGALMTRWRMWLATVLLILGVGCIASGGWWPMLGGLMLLFVPALIVDQASREKMRP